MTEHLVFLSDPGAGRFFLWSAGGAAAGARRVTGLATFDKGQRKEVRLVGESLAVVEVEGSSLPVIDALPVLAGLSGEELERASGSVAAWSLAAKLALELVGRERIVPRLVASGDGGHEARWGVALAAQADAERVTALARAMPLAAHAVPVDEADSVRDGTKRPTKRPRPADLAVWEPRALLCAFLDRAADALVRAARSGIKGDGPKDGEGVSTRAMRRRGPKPTEPYRTWEERFNSALTGKDARFEIAGFGERALASEIEAWVAPARGPEPGAPRGCFRLELPAGGIRHPGVDRGANAEDPGERPASARPRAAASKRLGRRTTRTGTPSDGDGFALGFLLQACDDPSLLVPAGEVWSTRSRRTGALARAFRAPREQLLLALGRAARIFPPIARGLAEAAPEGVALDPGEAWSFLTEAAIPLSDAGFGVILPAELTRLGARRVRLRLRVGGSRAARVAPDAEAGLGASAVFEFHWEAALGDQTLTARELAELAAAKAPLVRWRGEWVAVDPAELRGIEAELARGVGQLTSFQALTASLLGSITHPSTGLPVEVAADGALARAIERMKAGASAASLSPPQSLRAKLRPYQLRGLCWLATMAELGLGACLADDMGLGKTVQVLAFLLHRLESDPRDRRPALVVCPTSVLGNWEREVARFAPKLRVLRHYGPDRARTPEDLLRLSPERTGGALVLTTFGLLRRDAEWLALVDWSAAILDEAQNVKNPLARTARAARALRASQRFALTGTPIENRLSELWSILEFTSPGLLGPLEAFRRQYAVPIERYRDEQASARLARLVGPFVLRRLKSDPGILRDLPPKQEMEVACTLTREQASLYRAAVDEAMRRIEEARGIQRRGLVLALITSLKQICNHPAQFLGEAGPLAGRSGKLARLSEMLEEALSEGDRALVFTQYREMGDRLAAHLSRVLETEVLYLHGGVPRAARDELVRRFQEEGRAPPVFVLSLKAGGTGLNLTAANRVFHFDRWWNPAVEDQATDRAWRIGQKRAVLAHKLVCAGTIEEKVARVLEDKRQLAARIVRAGESWITELDDASLRELVDLSADAVVGSDEGEEDQAPYAGAEPRGRAGRRPEVRR